MFYIMVTNFEGHWNNIHSTTYTVRMFRQGMAEAKIIYGEEVKTLFIKRNKDTHAIEKCWLGTTKNFSKYENNKGIDTIKFDVITGQETECPEKYYEYNEGWYCDESAGISVGESETTKEWDPPFFSTLLTTTDPRKFEELSHKLLKIIGIHDLYPFPPERQRGIADGFFKIKKLAVMYDSTLEDAWEQLKVEQINNYCARLQGGVINYSNQTINIPDYDKQVLIITKNQSRFIRKINDVDVREISISKLMEIYRQRLIYNFSESQLEGKIRN